jgi:hypothetical protein
VPTKFSLGCTPCEKHIGWCVQIDGFVPAAVATFGKSALSVAADGYWNEVKVQERVARTHLQAQCEDLT